MVWRFYQHVANRPPTADDRSAGRPQCRGYVHVRAGGELQGNAVRIDLLLQILHGLADLRPGIVIQARRNAACRQPPSPRRPPAPEPLRDTDRFPARRRCPANRTIRSITTVKHALAVAEATAR